MVIPIRSEESGQQKHKRSEEVRLKPLAVQILQGKERVIDNECNANKGTNQ